MGKIVSQQNSIGYSPSPVLKWKIQMLPLFVSKKSVVTGHQKHCFLKFNVIKKTKTKKQQTTPIVELKQANQYIYRYFGPIKDQRNKLQKKDQRVSGRFNLCLYDLSITFLNCVDGVVFVFHFIMLVILDLTSHKLYTRNLPRM